MKLSFAAAAWLALLLALGGCNGLPPVPTTALKPGVPLPLENPGFTPDANGRVLPWTALEHASGNSYTFVPDTEFSVSPPASLRIRRHGTEVFGMSDQRLRVRPEWVGKTVRLSGFLRTQGASGEGGALILSMRDGYDNVVVSQHMDDRRVRGDSEWAEYAVDLKVPSNTWWIQVAVLLEGPGTLWADDLRLEQMD